MKYFIISTKRYGERKLDFLIIKFYKNKYKAISWRNEETNSIKDKNHYGIAGWQRNILKFKNTNGVINFFESFGYGIRELTEEELFMEML